MMILDVGCGSRPKGDVNLDLNLGQSTHHRFEYDIKTFKNFIQGSASDLPFRDKIFHTIFSAHCLEHVPVPLEAIREYKRVSHGRVILLVPNNPVLEDDETHLYAWSLVSFENFLKLVFDDVKVIAYSSQPQILGSRFVRKLMKIAVFKKYFSRIISRKLGIELRAICYI